MTQARTGTFDPSRASTAKPWRRLELLTCALRVRAGPCQGPAGGWGEAAGLTIANLDFLGGKVSVTHQLRRDGTLGPPKSAHGRRTLACPDWLLKDLAALLARRGLTGADDRNLIFTDGGGRALDYTNWRRRLWTKACTAADMPRLRFHDLRSLAATELVAAGVDIKTTQTRLGHSSPNMTFRLYARATVEADRKAADAVGDRLRPRNDRAMKTLERQVQ